jgi:hypothetical protein
MTGKTYRLFVYGIEEPKEYFEQWEAVAIMNATPTANLPAALFKDSSLIMVRAKPNKDYYGDK